MQINNKFRKSLGGYIHFCAGCDRAHYIQTDKHPAWTFNGDIENPTFGPSIRIYQPAGTYGENEEFVPEKTLCHYFIVAGQIQYLTDCDHQLAGVTTELPPLPEWMRGDNYGDGNP